MVQDLMPDHAQCLLHTTREVHPFIPFAKITRPTALYFLDRFRYGKYFSDRNPQDTSRVRTNWHKVKWEIQQEYQREMEQQGAILKDIFINRVAVESDSNAVAYLQWLDWTWQLYCKNLQRPDFEDEGFVSFCQTDLIWSEELVEPDCYGRNRGK